MYDSSYDNNVHLNVGLVNEPYRNVRDIKITGWGVQIVKVKS